MNLKALIIDDEDLARERIRLLLRSEPDIEVVGESSGGIEAVRAIEGMEPDLVFLDIQMPELDGFGIIDAVGPAHMPATVFITGHDQHALRAFESHALDYLLKPYEPERFKLAVERARAWCLRHQSRETEFEALLESFRKERPWLDRLLLRQGDSHILVRTRSIQWIEAEDNYIRIHVEGDSYLMRHTLGGILQRLDPRHFCRVHRSAIVNLDCIAEIRHSVQGDHQILMLDGTRLSLGRRFKDCLAQWSPSKSEWI